jgi:hypothetical protein
VSHPATSRPSTCDELTTQRKSLKHRPQPIAHTMNKSQTFRELHETHQRSTLHLLLPHRSNLYAGIQPATIMAIP